MPANNRLFRRMTLAGYGAAATAGAVTIGLIAGVAHIGTTSSSASTPSTTTTHSTSDDDGYSDDSGKTGTVTVAPAPQNTAPAGGSNGS